MSIGLVVERRGEAVEHICIDEWKQFVSTRQDVRLRTEPYFAVNPMTSQKITIPLGEADSEILVSGQWVPFLCFNRGRLVTEYQTEFEDPSNEIRIMIALAAKALRAVIGTDLSDEAFDWKLP